MKRVGIITYHKHYNYGTMLQALALQEAVKRIGCQAEIINFFQPIHMEKKERLLLYFRKTARFLNHPSEFSMRLMRRRILLNNKTNIRRRNDDFDSFYEKNIVTSKHNYNSSRELIENPPEYDVYLVGSDQTWNPNVGGNPDAFYLTFVPPKKVKASYAPSVSTTKLTQMQKDRLAYLLKNVDVLSCREQSGAELLKEITGRDVSVVLDPVFLLSKEEWGRFMCEVDHPSRYILEYFLGDNINHRKYVRMLSKMFNLPIISLPYNLIDFKEKNNINIWCGPGGFLSLIRDACIVCTDSFHGTAFSLLFEKEVYSFLKHEQNNQKSENSRIEDLYKRFGIEGHIVTDYKKELPEIDYQHIRIILRKQILESEKYLKEVLK